MSTTIWQILNMKLIQWPEPEIIWTAENCLEKFVKSHQVNLISADYSQFEPLCNRQTKTENIFLDLWLWIIRCRRTRPKRRRLRLFFQQPQNSILEIMMSLSKRNKKKIHSDISLLYDMILQQPWKWKTSFIHVWIKYTLRTWTIFYFARFSFFFFSLCCCFKKIRRRQAIYFTYSTKGYVSRAHLYIT